MERLEIKYEPSHAALTAVGRSWKVCWVEDALARGCPAVMVWCPERNAYYTLGSLAAAGGDSPAPVEAVIRAVVAVAKSTPAPPGLKHALTRDCDFLTLLGRKPANVNAPVSVGTTGGAKAAEAADAAAALAGRTLLEDSSKAAGNSSSEKEVSEKVGGKTDGQKSAGETSSSPAPATPELEAADGDHQVDEQGDARMDEDDGDASGDYFRPAPELDDFEWEDRARECVDGFVAASRTTDTVTCHMTCQTTRPWRGRCSTPCRTEASRIRRRGSRRCPGWRVSSRRARRRLSAKASFSVAARGTCPSWTGAGPRRTWRGRWGWSATGTNRR